jgi:hypothetical protein
VLFCSLCFCFCFCFFFHFESSIGSVSTSLATCWMRTRSSASVSLNCHHLVLRFDTFFAFVCQLFALDTDNCSFRCRVGDEERSIAASMSMASFGISRFVFCDSRTSCKKCLIRGFLHSHNGRGGNIDHVDIIDAASLQSRFSLPHTHTHTHTHTLTLAHNSRYLFLTLTER